LIVGEGGHIRRTLDGGETWSNSASGDAFRIKDVYFMSQAIGWEVGQFFRLAKTANGCQSWTTAVPLPQLATADLMAITFASDQVHGVAVGQTDTRSAPETNFHNKPKILWTDDNGSSQWHEPILVNENADTVSDFATLRCVAWAGDTTFWAAGQSGLIYKTTNGGNTWRQFRPTGESFTSFQDRTFHGVSFHDLSTGIFVGTKTVSNVTSGVAYLYKDGVWTDISPTDPSLIISSLNGVDATGSVAYAVGTQLGGPSRQGLILSSSLSGGAFGVFAPVANHPVISACTAGKDLRRISVLNRVRVAPSGDVWTGGECGRVWRLTGGNWQEEKSMTDAHVLGISFPPGTTVGYFGCHRQSDTQHSVVSYSP
jgi:hypothetical protein